MEVVFVRNWRARERTGVTASVSMDKSFPSERVSSHYRIKAFKKVHYMEVYKFILIQLGKTTQYIGVHDG